MDEKTFEELYEEHSAGLFGFLAYRTGDPVLAEDLLADTFERALTARRPFDVRRGKAKTWLYSIALNLLRDSARRSAAEHRALEQVSFEAANGNGNGNGSSPHERIEARQVIMSALEAVGDDEREALALRYGADLSLAEIGKVIGKPRSTVEGRIYRGLKHLRLELTGGGETPAEARESRAASDVG
jgi:RNA polymerase sigma factor (sigma-70 family)